MHKPPVAALRLGGPVCTLLFRRVCGGQKKPFRIVIPATGQPTIPQPTMDGNAEDLLEDMDYGDFNLLEGPSGDFSFEETFDGEAANFNDSAGSFLTSPQQPPSTSSQPLQPLQPPRQILQQPPPMRSMVPPPNSNTIRNSVSTLGTTSSGGTTENNNHEPRQRIMRQPWHNDENDRDVRRGMIIEMYAKKNTRIAC